MWEKYSILEKTMNENKLLEALLKADFLTVDEGLEEDLEINFESSHWGNGLKLVTNDVPWEVNVTEPGEEFVFYGSYEDLEEAAVEMWTETFEGGELVRAKQVIDNGLTGLSETEAIKEFVEDMVRNVQDHTQLQAYGVQEFWDEIGAFEDTIEELEAKIALVDACGYDIHDLKKDTPRPPLSLPKPDANGKKNGQRISELIKTSVERDEEKTLQQAFLLLEAFQPSTNSKPEDFSLWKVMSSTVIDGLSEYGDELEDTLQEAHQDLAELKNSGWEEYLPQLETLLIDQIEDEGLYSYVTRDQTLSQVDILDKYFGGFDAKAYAQWTVDQDGPMHLAHYDGNYHTVGGYTYIITD